MLHFFLLLALDKACVPQADPSARQPTELILSRWEGRDKVNLDCIHVASLVDRLRVDFGLQLAFIRTGTMSL